MLWQEKNSDERRNRGISDCQELEIYNQARVIIRQVFSLVAMKIIWIPVCLVLVLLYFSQSIIYQLLFINDMLDLITLVLANKIFFNSVLVYIILSNHKNPAHTTIKFMSIFNLLRSIILFFVISLQISFVIGRYMAFCFGKNLFPPLIIKDMRGVSKAAKYKQQLMWYDFRIKRQLFIISSLTWLCLRKVLQKM